MLGHDKPESLLYINSPYVGTAGWKQARYILTRRSN